MQELPEELYTNYKRCKYIGQKKSLLKTQDKQFCVIF